MISLRKTFFTRKFLKYLVVGFSGTALDFLILYLLVQYGHLHYVLGAFISVALVLWFSFSLNKFWTFANKDKKYFKQFLQYAASHGVALLINVAILVTLVEIFHFWYLLAKVFSTAAAAITNFLIIKRLIFDKKEKIGLANN